MTELFEYGVGIAGIAAVVLVVKMFMGFQRRQSQHWIEIQAGFTQFLQNHISDSTKTNQRLTDAVEMLSRMIEKNGGK